MLQGRLLPFTDTCLPHDRLTRPLQRVVQIGRDEELLRLRAKLIDSAGFTVLSLSPDEAPAEVRRGLRSKVWLFCHTLEIYELAVLAAAVRNQCPGDKLLRMTGLDDIAERSGLFDELIKPLDGVDDLLRAVTDLARQAS